jgi:hypothetical protein
MASTNVDKIFRQIEKDFVKLAKDAARSAANKAQVDIKRKADQFIDEYYSEYSPSSYKRKHALYNLIEPVYNESEDKKGIKIEFGVKYNASNIEDVHNSNSWYRKSGDRWVPRLSGNFDFDSQNNGIPQAAWITEKFISGIHPSGKIGDDGGAEFTSSDEKMQSFFDSELNNKLKSYISEALLGAVKKYF